MELIFIGVAFIACGILLLISISRQNRTGSGSKHMQPHNKSGLDRFVGRIEKLKMNRRNYLEPEQLSDNQKRMLERTNRQVKRIIAYVLIVIGFVFLIC